MAKRPSQIQILRSEFRTFKKEAIGILEALNDYNSEKDILGTERVKSEEIRKRINLLK